MSLDSQVHSLLADTIAIDDEQLFREYLNLDQDFDDDYNPCHNLQPSNLLPSLVTPPNPLPPHHPIVPAHSTVSMEPDITAQSTPTALATTTAATLSVLSSFVGSGIDLQPSPYPAWPMPLAQDVIKGSTSLAPSHGVSHVPRPTGLGTTATNWNAQQTMRAPGCGEVDRGSPCATWHAYAAMGLSVPFTSATAADTPFGMEKLYKAVGTSASQQGGLHSSAFMAQLQCEAKEVLGLYGNMLSPALGNPSQSPSDALPTVSRSSLVQRTTKAGDRNSTSVPYLAASKARQSAAHRQSKRTRVPGSYVCPWEGCSESFARKERVTRHVTSTHLHSKDHHCKYCKFACSREDNLRSHMKSCKSRSVAL